MKAFSSQDDLRTEFDQYIVHAPAPFLERSNQSDFVKVGEEGRQTTTTSSETSLQENKSEATPSHLGRCLRTNKSAKKTKALHEEVLIPPARAIPLTPRPAAPGEQVGCCNCKNRSKAFEDL